MKIQDLKFINGIPYPYEREMTPEEEEEYEKEQREIEEQERFRQPTAEEKLEAQILYTAMMTDTLIGGE